MYCKYCGVEGGHGSPLDCPERPLPRAIRAPRAVAELPADRMWIWHAASWALIIAVVAGMVVWAVNLTYLIRSRHLIAVILGTDSADTTADLNRLVDLARVMQVLGWITSGLSLVYFVGSIAWFITTRRVLARFGAAATEITRHWTFRTWRVLVLVLVLLNLAGNHTVVELSRSARTLREVSTVYQRMIAFGVLREIILAVVLFAVVRAVREVRRRTASVDVTSGDDPLFGPIAAAPAGSGAPSAAGPAVPVAGLVVPVAGSAVRVEAVGTESA